MKNKKLYTSKRKRYTVAMSGNEKVSVNYRLYAEPSALEGVARLIDFSGALNSYNVSKTADLADAKALCHDWVTVGHDLYKAIDQYAVDNHYHVVSSENGIIRYTGVSTNNHNHDHNHVTKRGYYARYEQEE